MVVIGTWAGAGALAGVAGAWLLAALARGAAVSPYWCGGGVAVLWAATGAAQPASWWVTVPLAVGWLAVLLSAVDIAAQRLPDVLTLPAYPGFAVLLGLAAVATTDAGMMVRGALGMLAWAGCYALIRGGAPSALGAGDLKLAGPLGAVTAAASWSGLLLAMLGAAVLTAAMALPARLLGHRQVPHGPAMLTAAWLVVL